VLGAAFAGATFVTAVIGCALFLPINRADFWRGFVVAWMMIVGVTIVGGGVVFAATRLRLMP